GGLGHDIIFGGTVNDKLKGKAGNDQLVGNAGDDKLKGGLQNDRIFGDDGADKAKGGWGDDIILGGAGDDVKLKGGLGNDRIHGGTGADKIKGNLGIDTLDTGHDSVRDKVFGGWRKDVIYADKGEDRIRRKRELVSNSSDNDSGIDSTTRPVAREGERFIYGCKWEDSNGDGIRQPGEPAVIGWEIFADLNGNLVRDPGEPWTTTQADDPATWPNEDGCYCLLVPQGVDGSFSIQEQLNPDLYEPSFPNGTGTYHLGSSTCLDGGEIYTGLDFGNVPVPTDEWVKVSGRKWYDLNGDGVFQDEEINYNSFIVGTLIWADLNGDGVLSPGEPHTRVDKAGNYCLRIPVKQRVFLCEDPSSNFAGIEMVHTYPAGDRPCHIISGGNGDVSYDFGNKKKEKIDTIVGVVWHDLNSDGDYSRKEPVVTGGRVVLDENRNGRADQGELSGQIDKEGRFVIQIPIDCLPPNTGFDVIYDCQNQEQLGRTNVTRVGDFSTEGGGGSRLVFIGLGEDCDCDGLADSYERKLGTSPKLVDSDRDGLLDRDEVVMLGTSPTESDSDRDGLNDLEEIQLGTDPHCADCDGDGLLDGSETGQFDPLDPDSDDDGIWDGVAVQLGLLPGKPDRDGDGASDFMERYVFLTNPDLSDTDGDGFNDLEEGAAGFSPLSKLDNPNRGLFVEPGGRVARFEVSQAREVEFEVLLEVGQSYCLEKTSDLMNWEELSAFEATQRVNAFQMPKTDARCYYRVRQLQQP
ncbi:MAG: Ca2+-binding RTX toxin-like protein, partial [Akkermansiaceae bacterium]